HRARGRRKSLKYLVPAAVVVLDELCPLYQSDRTTPITDFEVDSRPVTIPATKGRVMRHRARFNEWVVVVTLRIDEDILEEAIVRQLLMEGAAQIGIGDYRPEKGARLAPAPSSPGTSSIGPRRRGRNSATVRWRGVAWRNSFQARRGPARHGGAWLGDARPGMARRGLVRRGNASEAPLRVRDQSLSGANMFRLETETWESYWVASPRSSRSPSTPISTRLHSG